MTDYLQWDDPSVDKVQKDILAQAKGKPEDLRDAWDAIVEQILAQANARKAMEPAIAMLRHLQPLEISGSSLILEAGDVQIQRAATEWGPQMYWALEVAGRPDLTISITLAAARHVEPAAKAAS